MEKKAGLDYQRLGQTYRCVSYDGTSTSATFSLVDPETNEIEPRAMRWIFWWESMTPRTDFEDPFTKRLLHRQ